MSRPFDLHQLRALFGLVVLPWAAGLSWLVPTPVGAQTEEYPPEVVAVVDHIRNVEYLEAFTDGEHDLRVEDVLIRDLDGDGRNEVVLQMSPHFRNSATLVLYTFGPEGQVRRVKQGLAPGPLVPASGEFLDAHELGQAADLAPDGDIDAWVRIAVSQGNHVVRYRDFIHLDTREGSGGFIDLSDRPEFPGATECSAFEFSKVETTVVGSMGRVGGRNHVVASTEGAIHVHAIDAISDEGLLTFRTVSAPKPPGFLALVELEDGRVGYETLDGVVAPLVVPGF